MRELCADVDLDALCEVVVNRDLVAAFPDRSQDEAFTSRLRASVRENLSTLQAVLCGHRSVDEVRLKQALIFGEVQAQLGIPQATLQKSYRVGFVAMWEAWMCELASRVDATGVAADEALAASAALLGTILAYQDHVASLVAEAHARTDEALNRSREYLRHRLVRGLLRSDDETLSPSDQLTVGYDLDTHHIAVVCPDLAVGAASRLVVGIRCATGVRDSLVYAQGLTSTVIWVGHADGWSSDRQARLTAVLTTAGVRASVSDAKRDLAGFRHSYQQAQDVERVRSAWGAAVAPRMITYATVALEILLMKDPEAARRFVRAELGSLGGRAAEDVRLRETLEASFRYGSHVTTAEHLGVHEHTVRNRLQKIEEKLGRPWTARSTELQVALRLHRLVFATSPPRGHGTRAER